MSFSSETKVRAVRKDHRCVGCGKMIRVGEPATRWAGVTDGDFGSCIYHPDCREAEVALNDRGGGFGGDWFQLLNDVHRDDVPWLRESFPAVACRLFGPVAVSEGQ